MHTHTAQSTAQWVEVAEVSAWPHDGGMAVKLGTEEIAIFNFASRGEWYAASNMCPHKQQMILARGIIGDKADEPKVVCPYHKKQFSLKSGKNLDDHDCSSIRTYPIKVENGRIYIGL